MKRKMTVLLSLVMVLCMIPLSGLAGLRWGEIVRITSNSAVNVRKGPGTEYGMVGEAMSTNTYTYLGTENGWHHIQFTSSEKGYVPSKYSAVEPGLVWEEYGADEVEAVVRNTHYNALNVRKGPGQKYGVIAEIKPDSTWPYCGTENGWHRILYNGSYAYVAANRSSIEVVDTYAGSTSSGEPCYDCGGSGVCRVCDGLGVIYDRKTGYNIECPTCEGEEICWTCGGDGLY